MYLEALEILSCESKQHLKMHSVSTRQEGGATPGREELTFEICFESETASFELVDLLPSCRVLIR